MSKLKTVTITVKPEHVAAAGDCGHDCPVFQAIQAEGIRVQTVFTRKVVFKDVDGYPSGIHPTPLNLQTQLWIENYDEIDRNEDDYRMQQDIAQWLMDHLPTFTITVPE